MNKTELKTIRINNLKKWFEDRTLPQKDKSLISQLMSGKASFGEKVSRRLEEEYGMGVGYLDGQNTPKPESNAKITGVMEAWNDNTPLIDDDCEIPLYKETQFSAGSGAFEQADYSGNKLRFSERTLRNNGVQPQNAVCVSITGNSMEPVLPDGAVIGINLGETQIKDGKIYAINHGGMLRAKILYRLPEGKIKIRSYNREEYEDEEVASETVQIIGKVFWWSVLA